MMLPPAVLVREVGRPFVDHAGGAVAQRPEDDVAVSGHPADVGRAPVDRVGLDVEDVVVRGGHADEVAGGGVHDALRLGGGAAGVQQVEEILGVHLLRWTRRRFARRFAGGVVQPDVPIRLHRNVTPGSTHDEAPLHGGRQVHRGVAIGLEGDTRASPPAFVLGDQELALHVVEAPGERLSAEAAEHDGEGRPDSRAREHRHGSSGIMPM